MIGGRLNALPNSDAALPVDNLYVVVRQAPHPPRIGFGVAFLFAIEDALEGRADYGMLIKQYAEDKSEEKRYSPAHCIGCKQRKVMGSPDSERISTSHVERQNLTMRMQMRRLTRLTNGFSKKWENHWAALALHFGYYNFCRIHSTIRVTPAMEAGITDHVWDLAELLS